MQNKILLSIVALGILLVPTPAFALDSDLQYNFATENEEEYYKTGVTNININGQVPDYLQNIYDLTPQQVHNSDYGATIIVPDMSPQISQGTYAPSNAPVGSVSPVGGYGSGNGGGYGNGNGGGTIGTGSAENVNNGNWGGSSNTIPEYSGGVENQQYPLTSIEEVRNENGSIGTLRIPEIDLKVTAYDGDTYEAMKKGIGHISSTSAWKGNIGLVGHNRGGDDYFRDLKRLEIGDEITYKTNLGTKTYVVDSIKKINETDWSMLEYTMDNRITLLTCVEDVPSQRLCVQAREKL